MSTLAAQELSEAFLERLRLPAYTVGESARLAGTKPQTLGYWFRGARPVVPGRSSRERLSYLQLVEAAFVASFRRAGVSMGSIRRARDYLAETFGAEHPFAQYELQTDGAHILKELPGGTLIAADWSGQEGWERLLAERIAQFDYVSDLAARWHFRGRGVPLVVDPRISFGAPTVEKSGIATWALAGRFRAGESREEIREEFSVSADELDAALDYEGLLQAA